MRPSIIQFSLEVMGMKKAMEKNIVNNSFSKEAATLPASMYRKLDIQTHEIGFTGAVVEITRNVWTLSPKSALSSPVVLFLHGGAYYANITRMHWRLIEQLALSTGARFIVPDYPLAPEKSCIDAYQFMDQVYAQLLADYPTADIVLMGDSAGSGLALGYAQKLYMESIRQPSRIILLSPWLDVSMTNPDLTHYEHRDKILSIDGLKIAGKAWAGEADVTDYRVSPLYGSFRLPGKISIFTGTNDLLVADARKLKHILEEQQIAFDYFEYPEMFHDWVLIGQLQETKETIATIKKLI